MYTDNTIIYFNTEDLPKDNLVKHITTELDKDVWLKHNICHSLFASHLNYGLLL